MMQATMPTTRRPVFVKRDFEVKPGAMAWLHSWVLKNEIQVILRGSIRECIETVVDAVGGPYSRDDMIDALEESRLMPRCVGRNAYVIVFDPDYEKSYPGDWYM